MPEDYEPAVSDYEDALGIVLDLNPIDVTEEEIDSALEELHNE